MNGCETSSPGEPGQPHGSAWSVLGAGQGDQQQGRPVARCIRRPETALALAGVVGGVGQLLVGRGWPGTFCDR
jgi:hypothetical protein